MGKRTGDPKPYYNKPFSLCVTEKYLYFDLSVLFDCPAGLPVYSSGLDMVATFVRDKKVICLFAWEYPGNGLDFSKNVMVDYGDWWMDCFLEGQRHNREYNNWIKN